MKLILVLIAVVVTLAGARADLIMQQQITAPNYEGVTTMKIKGAKVRMDLYAGQPQALSIITDLSTGEIVRLLHTQKMYLKTVSGPAQTKTPGRASQAPVARSTGKTQKVGDYDTELYTWSNTRGISGTAWVAKNFPDFARIRTDIAVLDKTATGPNDTTPELSTLPGMVVRSQVSGSGQTITLALISAKEAPLDASLFAIPQDYKELPRPKPLKQVTSQNPAPKTANNSKPAGVPPASGGSQTSSGSKTSGGPKTPSGDFSTPKPPDW